MCIATITESRTLLLAFLWSPTASWTPRICSLYFYVYVPVFKDNHPDNLIVCANIIVFVIDDMVIDVMCVAGILDLGRRGGR